jgi:hypothetical protein
VLDVILVTGDIIDYLFEDTDDHNGGGNALFARELILGRRPSPTFEDVEELRLPIFLVAGNHDYRRYPYHLLFNVDLGPRNAAQIQNFSGYNLHWGDALAVSRGDNLGDVPERSTESAAKMVEVDEENTPFTAHLADRGSYMVQLGTHRVAMLDSSWDVGVVDNPIEFLVTWLGPRAPKPPTCGRWSASSQHHRPARQCAGRAPLGLDGQLRPEPISALL